MCTFHALRLWLCLLAGLPLAGTAAELEDRIQRLEAAVQSLQAEVAELRTYLEQRPVAAEPAAGTEHRLMLQDWSFRAVQVKFHSFQALDLLLHNGYDKAIREMEARLDFTDLLGEHVYSLRLPARLEIPARADVTERGTARNKRLFGKGAVLEKISRDHVRAELVIKRIVFEDGSVEEFTE